MGNEYEREENLLDAVERFEGMIDQDIPTFLELEVFEAIINYYKSNSNVEKALAAGKVALEQHPYSSEMLLEIATLLLEYDKAQEALDYVEKAANLCPNNAEIQTTKAQIYYALQQHANAIQTLKSILPFTPAKDEIYRLIAYMYLDWNKPQKAIPFYHKAIDENLSNEQWTFELNLCYEFAEVLEDGIQFYQNHIDRDPYLAEAWYNLGTLQAKNKKYDSAIQSFDYVTIIEDDHAAAYAEMGHCYMNLEAFKEAQKAYEYAIKNEFETADILCCLAASHEKQNEFATAIKYYRKSSQLDPSWSDAWFGIGNCLISQEKWYEAVHFIRKAIKLDDSQEQYWFSLANTEAQIGNMVASIEAFDKAADLFPTHKDIWLNWSLLYYDMGDDSKAFATISEGMEVLPEEAALYYRAVAYLITAGRYKEAFQFLENALVLDFEKHETLYEFFPDLETQKAIYRIIEQYKKDNY